MRALCRSYDLADPAGSGAAMRRLAETLREHGDEVWITADALGLDAVTAWQPDVVIAHQWATSEGAQWATALGKPFVMLVHGPRQYEQFMPPCDLVLFDTPELLAPAQPALGPTPARALNAGAPADIAAIRHALIELAARGAAARR
jgi:hypothetical protein